MWVQSSRYISIVMLCSFAVLLYDRTIQQSSIVKSTSSVTLLVHFVRRLHLYSCTFRKKPYTQGGFALAKANLHYNIDDGILFTEYSAEIFFLPRFTIIN